VCWWSLPTDDADFWAGGTVARWTGAGITVTYGVLSDGTPAASTPDSPVGQPRHAPSRAGGAGAGLRQQRGAAPALLGLSAAELLSAAERAGLPHIRFHDLRHTAATLLLGLGIHPKIVSELLGHSQIGITLDLYSHVTATMQQEAMRAFEGLLGSQEGPPKTRTPAQGP
jgi:integrase